MVDAVPLRFLLVFLARWLNRQQQEIIEYLKEENRYNKYFGEQLEVHFGRDGTEALHCLQHGIKKPSESSERPYKRLTVTVEQEGPFHGARATTGPDAGNGVQPIPLPQVGFCRRGEACFQWLLESELTDEKLAPYKSTGWQINVIGLRPRTRILWRSLLQ